ncbi:MAG: FG-GAP-like repeat-containing protein [Granulicella sp.]
MSRTGSWGNYTLGATVTEIGSTATPAGTVSFVDTDNGNTVLGSGALGAGVPGTGWLSSTLTPVSRALKNLATGDFNEDGIADIAANFIDASNNSSLAILLGHGDGTFAAPSFTLPVGHGPTFIIIGDLNQDGHQDFALHGSVDDTATIFLGKGDGTFTTGSTFLINGSLASIVTGDFNGDGKADLAFASVYPSNLSIYFNNGDGTFSLGSSIPLPANCLSLMAVDLNADGKTDIVVGSPNIVMLLLGAGDGTFTSTTGLTTPREAASFATGDFNGDGQLDLAVGNFNNTEGETAPVSIFLGNGNGTFNLVPSSISVPSPSSIAVVDLNQDGISDLVIPNYVGSGVSVLFGKGDGTFAPSPVVPTTTSIPSGTVAVDVNGDGIPDLLTGNFDSTISIDITRPTVTATTPTVTILPSAPGAHLVNASYPGSTLYQPSTSTADLLWGQPPATATALVVTAGGGAVSTVPANTVIALTATVTAGGSPITSGQINFCDVMAPNCADIHLIGSAQVTSTGTAVFRFVPGSGIHQYKTVFLESAVGVSSTSPSATLIVQAPAAIPVPTITTIAQSGSVGNYTLAATVSSVGSHEPLTGNVTFEDTNNSNAVLTSAQLGTGTAGIAWVPTFTATQGNPNFLQFAGGDFNGDGHPDVATINSNTLTVNIYLGNGDATYTTGTSLTLATLATYATGVVAGDFNGDDILDLAVTGSSYTAGSLAIYFGHGDGTFAQAAAALTVGYLAQVFAAVDINGDGKLDLIINEYYAGTRILFGNGDGSFSQGPVNGLATTAAVADLNGDGMPDIVAGNSGEVYLGNGDGTFHPAAALPVSFYGPVVSVGDFNGDGILDLSINSQDYSGVAILLGKGDGTFTQAADTPSVSINEPLASAVGDFNRDGKLDILISNENAYQGNTINPDLTLLLGNGDGTFTKGALDTQFNGTAAILVQDVNGDGTADIILDTGVMSVLLTEPTQTYVATVTGVAVTGPGPHSVEAVYAGDTNYTTSTSTTTSLLSQVAAPTFSLSAGTYTSVQTVTITDATPGATMYYSLNGPTNSTGAFVPYTGAVSLPSSGSYTLQAYAIATGYQQSSTSSATYILNLPPVTTPTLSPAPGVYSSAQIVTITETVPGATVYYTVNGRSQVQAPVCTASLFQSMRRRRCMSWRLLPDIPIRCRADSMSSRQVLQSRGLHRAQSAMGLHLGTDNSMQRHRSWGHLPTALQQGLF